MAIGAVAATVGASLGGMLMQNRASKKAEQAQSDAIGAFIGQQERSADISRNAIRNATRRGSESLENALLGETRVIGGSGATARKKAGLSRNKFFQKDGQWWFVTPGGVAARDEGGTPGPPDGAGPEFFLFSDEIDQLPGGELRDQGGRPIQLNEGIRTAKDFGFEEESKTTEIPGALPTLQQSESRVLAEFEKGRQAQLDQLSVLDKFTEERNPFQDDINAELERQLGRQASAGGQFRSGATAEALTREIGSQERQDRTRRLNLLQQLTGQRAGIEGQTAAQRAQTIGSTQSNIANLIMGFGANTANIQTGQGAQLANINQQLSQQLGNAQLSAGAASASQAIGRGNQLSQLFSSIPFADIGDKVGDLFGKRAATSTSGIDPNLTPNNSLGDQRIQF